jgi:hypothetical protein
MWTANNVHLFGKTATVFFACLNKVLRFMSHVKINDFNLLITFLPLLCKFSNTTKMVLKDLTTSHLKYTFENDWTDFEFKSFVKLSI